jgi:hypothetical protein
MRKLISGPILKTGPPEDVPGMPYLLSFNMGRIEAHREPANTVKLEICIYAL